MSPGARSSVPAGLDTGSAPALEGEGGVEERVVGAMEKHGREHRREHGRELGEQRRELGEQQKREIREQQIENI